MIDVSIVTGTYNRLPYMRQMVSSIRNSVGPLSYEIILVDGGSTDGTIKWCKKQPDITIIEQGELLGAVKAFNTGAKSARGVYTVFGNDDIEFVDLSILRSYSYMERNREVGIGCFYQDRDGKNWHVEQMPAISPIGIQISVPYGQVCIIPTWLGNEVGWWGDYLYTYGGDNEMSCNVLELGYDISPIECACIHDMRVEDDLRIINKGDPSHVGAVHPDSAKWLKKWSNRGKVGARLSFIQKVKHDMPEAHKRILYAPIYEAGHKLQRKTKVGLRKALEKIGIVHECDYMNEGVEELLYSACAICPDLFILQLQDANTVSLGIIQELRMDHPDAIFVSWNGDYHPDNLKDSHYIEVMKRMDHAGFAVASIKDLYESRGVNWFYWQIGYEESNAKVNAVTKCHDVVFLGNSYSKTREDLGRFLISLRSSGVDVGLYGTWPGEWSSGNNLYDFDSGNRIYTAARLAISDQQWPSVTGYVSNRLFQAMAAGGCLVLQQHFAGMEAYLGLVAGNDPSKAHLDTWKDYQELEDKIGYYLHHGFSRRMIAKKGHEYMLEHHSFDVRVKELTNVLGW